MDSLAEFIELLASIVFGGGLYLLAAWWGIEWILRKRREKR